MGSNEKRKKKGEITECQTKIRMGRMESRIDGFRRPQEWLQPPTGSNGSRVSLIKIGIRNP